MEYVTIVLIIWGGGFFKNTTGLKFMVIDSVGNTLFTKLYQRNDKMYTYLSASNHYTALKDGTFLISFSVMDTALAVYNPTQLNMQVAIMRFDSMGNVLMYKEYDRPYCNPTDDTYHNLKDFKPDAYGNWLMLSTLICNKKVVFCLRKLDSNFNELWVKNFNTNGFNHIPNHLLIEGDGYVMTGGIDNSNASEYTNYYSSILIKCDTAGNKLWDWKNTFDASHIQYIINDIVRTKDGGYVYCGSGEGTPYFYSSGAWAGVVMKGYVEKLDASRNSVWKRTLSALRTDLANSDQRVLKELPDGDIIIAGSAPKLLSVEDTAMGGWIHGSVSRLNGVDGNIEWQHFYGSPDKNDTMFLGFYDMRKTEDGGYILAGESRNLVDRGIGPIQRGWLLKVDSNGCEGPSDAQCWPVSIANIPAENTFNIYPNPSESSFELSYSKLKQASSLSVSNMLGISMLQANLPAQENHFTIDASQWPAGVYVYRLESGDGVVSTGKLIKK